MFDKAKFPDKNCTFCGEEEEKSMHLFYDCKYARNVWSCLLEILKLSNLNVQLSPFKCLFTAYEFHPFHPTNTLFNWTRYYIWLQKCFKKIPETNGLRNYIKNKIGVQDYMYHSTGREERFKTVWTAIGANCN